MPDFVNPERKILNQFDLNPWFFSMAYTEYLQFLHTINDSVKGVKTSVDIPCSAKIMALIDMLEEIQSWTKDFPPEEMEAQRYGNKAYRKWYDKFSQSVDSLLENVLPEEMRAAVIELKAYLLDAFGNSTRIDYGSGHEMSFLVFCMCLYKIGYLEEGDHQATALRIFAKYLRVCRALQMEYRMEPAGSQGVHSIDDFQFVPFLWGSAQLVGNRRLTPDSYTRKEPAENYAHESLFFDAVNFIFQAFSYIFVKLCKHLQVKTGPFHEHSNQLWNISAVPSWDKVNMGMFKMYEGEVGI
ncbi:hypothetical protein WR25_00722 [Diploscapter pachys]|uniref:Serine/threonine-protein phosphatase 2A activator n=1 Tax=Diploscapter pachys TaxID=2018661 RepID=A0A2A2LET7_9BILA|nr:hypothetical protein WR25_00722 [Diploscapter pachys]